jgi:hypothetical protein
MHRDGPKRTHDLAHRDARRVERRAHHDDAGCTVARRRYHSGTGSTVAPVRHGTVPLAWRNVPTPVDGSPLRPGPFRAGARRTYGGIVPSGSGVTSRYPERQRLVTTTRGLVPSAVPCAVPRGAVPCRKKRPGGDCLFRRCSVGLTEGSRERGRHRSSFPVAGNTHRQPRPASRPHGNPGYGSHRAPRGGCSVRGWHRRRQDQVARSTLGMPGDVFR